MIIPDPSGIGKGAVMPEEKKSGFAAIVGRPNVGKSTLMNHLIGQKIAITSRKPQTTRNRIQTVYTSDRGQIVFQDTPGIIKSRNALGDYMVGAAEGAMRGVDVILWLVEPEPFIGKADEAIAGKLSRSSVPVILVINKTDRVKKAVIGEVIRAYEKICRFDDIIAVSAKHGTNLEELLETVFRFLPYGPMFYDEDTITDQPMRQIVSEIIREKALRNLGEEIPHGIAVVIERMEDRTRGSVTDIDAVIICEKSSHKGIIIGKGGSMLKKIGSEARADIEKMTERKANLKLWVKVRKDWRENELLVKNYGYDKRDLADE